MDEWLTLIIVLGGLIFAGFLGWCGFIAIREKRSSWKVFHAFSWASILIITNNPKFHYLAIEYGKWKLNLAQLQMDYKTTKDLIAGAQKKLETEERRLAATLLSNQKITGNPLALPSLHTVSGVVASYQDVEQAIDKDKLFGKSSVGDMLILQKFDGKTVIELFDSVSGKSKTVTIPNKNAEAIEQAIKISPSTIYLDAPASSLQRTPAQNPAKNQYEDGQ